MTVALAIDKIASAGENYRRLYLRIITKSYFVYNNIAIINNNIQVLMCMHIQNLDKCSIHMKRAQ